jgi:hypothetical protein
MVLRIAKSEARTASSAEVSLVEQAASGGILPSREDRDRSCEAGIWEDFRMKLPYASATALSLTILGAAIALPARAQTYDPNYPVCLQVYQGGIADFYFECHYRTMAQCQATASGRFAQCVVNPYYGGPKAKRNKRQQRSRQY